MNNTLLQLKFKQRLNVLSSNDYDSFEKWMIVEAFNKEQNAFVREGARHSGENTQNVDDLQPVVCTAPLIGVNNPGFYQAPLPADYFAGMRISAKGVSKECPDGRKMVVYDGEEANLDVLLHDANLNPSFDWAETFQTIRGNNVRIYTDKTFDIVDPTITYYAKPRPIAFDDCVNEFDEPTSDKTCVFNDDVIEILIDRSAAQLAGDVERFQQMQRLSSSAPQK